MPTPIGHALAGIAIAAMPRAAQPKAAHVAALAFFAAAPDLDLVLRLADGMNHHRGPSHSFAAAAIASVMGFVLRRFGADLPSGGLIGAAWGSHVALDYFGLDTSPPIGEMALWPFSNRFFASSVSVFYDVPRSFVLEAIMHNALAVAIELVILGPVAWLCWRRAPRS